MTEEKVKELYSKILSGVSYNEFRDIVEIIYNYGRKEGQLQPFCPQWDNEK